MTIIPRIAGAMQHVLATVGDTIARGTGSSNGKENSAAPNLFKRWFSPGLPNPMPA